MFLRIVSQRIKTNQKTRTKKGVLNAKAEIKKFVIVLFFCYTWSLFGREKIRMLKELFGKVSKEEYEYFKLNTMLNFMIFIEPSTQSEYLLEQTSLGELKAIAKKDNGNYEFFEKVIYPTNRQIELEYLKSEILKHFKTLDVKLNYNFISEDEPNLYVRVSNLTGSEDEKAESVDLLTRFINNYSNINYVETELYVSKTEKNNEEFSKLSKAELIYNYGEPF